MLNIILLKCLNCLNFVLAEKYWSFPSPKVTILLTLLSASAPILLCIKLAWLSLSSFDKTFRVNFQDLIMTIICINIFISKSIQLTFRIFLNLGFNMLSASTVVISYGVDLQVTRLQTVTHRPVSDTMTYHSIINGLQAVGRQTSWATDDWRQTFGRQDVWAKSWVIWATAKKSIGRQY